MPITMTDVQTTVVEALESFGAEPEEIVREAKLKDLDVDSLDLAELSQIVEDRYGVELTGSDVERIKTVGDAIDAVVERAG
ncbi:MAG: acyl carrier protein [Solirubrobacteraceae bacterium]|jgi:acyl carrier protein|nr:acyl carrier protein [Solirubrobacteraceae bacterium]